MGDVITLVVNMEKKGFEKGCTELRGAITSLSKTAGKMAGAMKSLIPSIIGVGSAYGVITKAVGTFMAQNQRLTKQMEAVWTALGNLIGPIVERLIGWVVTAVSYLLSFLKLLGVTGKTASQLSKSANKAGSDLKKTIAGFDELNVLQDDQKASLPDFTPKEWMSEFADLLKNGQFAEAGRYLADKLNQMIDDIDWVGIGRKIAYCFQGAIDFLGNFIRDFDAHNLGKHVAELFNQILNIDTSSEDTWKNLGEILVAKFTLVFDFLTGFLEELDTAALAEAVSGVIIGALEALSDSIATADWEKIGENIGKFFENIDWEGIADAMWKAFTTAFAAASDLYEGLPDWLQDIALGLAAVKAAGEGIKIFDKLSKLFSSGNGSEAVGLFGKLAEVIGYVTSGAGTLHEAMELVFGKIATTFGGIATVVAGVVTAVTNFWEMLKNGFNWLNEILMVIGIAIAAVGAVILGVPASIAAVAAAVVAAVATAIVLIKEHWEEIKEWFSNTCEAIGKFFSDLWASIVKFVLDTVASIKKKWEEFKTWISDTCKAIGEFFSGLWDSVTEFASGAWEKIVQFVTDCIDKVKNAWNNFKEFISGLWDGIVSGIKGAVNSIIGCVNGMISGAVNGVNAVGSALNRIKFTIPNWVPYFGGSTFGFNIPQVSAPQIPYLEKGGVLKKGQVGILEGKGGEAVVPLEKNTEWINKMADAFMLRVKSGDYDLTGGAKTLAALSDIADRVSYRTPAVAQGTITPYSVDRPSGNTPTPQDGSELLASINDLSDKFDQILYLLEHLQFVADFGDNIRALARRITKEQRRDKISEGK